MAVFTPVTAAQAAALTLHLDVGELLTLEGVSEGIENTNYFVTTDRGEWVLTLFERLRPEQLPFYLGLTQHLARRGLPVPEPRADASGQLLHSVAGKPAALVNRFSGQHQLAPDLHHCAQLGSVLARMHLAVADFPLRQSNLRGLAWWLTMAPQLQPHLTKAQRQLLQSELSFQQQVAASPSYAALPRGAVHADLFRDNVLFDGLPGHEKLTACFDFYFAGTDRFAYDLAICLNDWCLAADGSALDEARAQALVQAYEGERPLLGAEVRLLPALLRAAALRFWISRLGDQHLPRDAALLQPKNPGHFERILRARIDTPWHPPVR
jgi:homoserine kinase type II